MTVRRVVALGDSDTRLKWAVAAAKTLAEDGPVVVGIIRSQIAPSTRQLAESVGAESSIVVGTAVELLALDEVRNADALTLCGTTSIIAAVHEAMSSAQFPRRPVLVTGYAGLVYEFGAEGLSWRVGSDVICANSRSDEQLFRSVLRAYGRSPDQVVCLGFPQFGRSSERFVDGSSALTFAVQPDVPSARSEREYIVARLLEFARLNPSLTVIVKLRSRPGERTTHPEPHHYERIADTLFAKGAERPANLVFEYGPMAPVLDRTGFLVTISSTAAVEAMLRGIPTGILTDLGISERYGNHAFLGSGCLVTFDDIDAGIRPTARREWLEVHATSENGPTALRRRVDELRRQWDTDPAPLPELLPHVRRRLSDAKDSVIRGRLRQAARGPLRNATARLQHWVRE